MQLLNVLVLRLPRLTQDKQGQDLIEYALLSAFIVVIVAALVPNLADSINSVLSTIGSELAAAIATGGGAGSSAS
jgi:Flp pilus assembly pilin Flp